MKFARLVSLVATIVSVSMLVMAAPIATFNRSDLTGGCGGCSSGDQALSLMSKLQADVRGTLALLDKCRTTGNNPASLFIELVTKVDQCNSAMAAVEVDGTGFGSKTKTQVLVSDIAAKIILDISTGCSKFQSVKIEGFDYTRLSSKIDMSLKGLCVTLDGLIKGCLRLISSICLPKSLLLSAANFKACFSIISDLRTTL